MSNHLLHILSRWFPERTQKRWALATVRATEGSVYRKAGAMMLISDHNDMLGMLSGGCLESDLQLQAHRVIETGISRNIAYDAADEGSVAWQLGIGCGGVAHIVIHPCCPGNQFLALDEVYQSLLQRRRCLYRLHLSQANGTCGAATEPFALRASADSIDISLSPPPHLLVFGSGVDVVPIARMATELGWSLTLVDKRASHYKPQRFPKNAQLLNCAAAELEQPLAAGTDAVIIATHSVSQDAEALAWVQNSNARYCGMLGPKHRRERVLSTAGMQERDLRIPLAGPMGLALGGELPESIALSVLAECHAVLFGSSAGPLSEAYLT